MQITQASLANGRNPISILNLTNDQRIAYDDIIKFINSDFNPNDYRRALVGPAGSGKALVNGTKVLTDKGWQNIETIKIGDKVATPYNGFVTVNGVYPQGYKEYLYKITFSDGREIICDEHHLWLVRTKRQLYYYRIIKGKNTRYSKIIETSQLYKERNELFDNKLGCKYRIPNCAIENSHKYLPIPPYSLGVIIGDGCLTDNYAELSEHLHISNNEQDIITKVANELNCNYKWHKEYNYTNDLFGDNILLINKYLDDFNLRVKSVDKFIPRIYLESSIEQRKELLKGLMDTDGSVVGGRYTFTTSSEKLLDDVIELCRSLGYIVGKYLTDRRGSNFSYTIHIQTNDIIASSQKHLSKVKTDKNKYYDSIGIKSIEKIKGNRQTTCISVDDKDKLYVAENYIVTHNTYLVNALITNCNLSYSTIGLSAPTHKACRVLSESIKNSSCKVITLQSALGLRLNFDVEKFDINNPPFDPKGKIKIQDLKLFIVDEASMINKGLKTFLEKICSNKQCKVLYIGDGSQLPPVNERASSAFEHIKLFKLNQIVRQDEDNPVRNLLQILRDDITNNTFNFVSYITRNKQQYDESYIKGWQLCSSKEFSDIIYNNFNDEQLTTNVDYCKILAYTNNCVSAWNKFVRNAIIKDADKTVINKNDLILSYTTIVDQYLSPIILNSEEYIVKDIVNYVHPRYQLKGFMVKFIAIHGGKETQPLFIVDHSDAFTIQKYMQISNDLIDAAKKSPVRTRAQRWKDYYSFKESCLLLTNIIKRDGTIVYSRDLDYGFSLSTHKAQGSTYDTVFVDLTDILYDKNGRPYTKSDEIKRLIYTACSRCRNKLYIKFG